MLLQTREGPTELFYPPLWAHAKFSTQCQVAIFSPISLGVMVRSYSSSKLETCLSQNICSIHLDLIIIYKSHLDG